jgi:hypothetical protein
MLQRAINDMAKMISLLLAFFSLVISIGIGIAVAIIVPAYGTDVNATIRCFVPDIDIDPGFVRNGTNENIDPSFIRNDSSFVIHV